MSILIKYLSPSVEVTSIVIGRCLVGLFVLLPVIYKQGFSTLKSSQIKLHLARGCCMAFAINLGFYSLAVLPVTTVTVLFFAGPFFVTLLSGPMLGEVVGWRRFCATAIGFVGVLIVINPVAVHFDLRLLIPVVCSAFFAISLITHKQLSKTDSPAVLMFYMYVSTLFLTLPFSWQGQSVTEPSLLLGILCVGLAATMRSYADIKAYTLGEASFVAPFQYLRILFVSLLAYLVFHEVLSSREWVGTGVIILSTLYIAHRELRSPKNQR